MVGLDERVIEVNNSDGNTQRLYYYNNSDEIGMILGEKLEKVKTKIIGRHSSDMMLLPYVFVIPSQGDGLILSTGLREQDYQKKVIDQSYREALSEHPEYDANNLAEYSPEGIGIIYEDRLNGMLERPNENKSGIVRGVMHINPLYEKLDSFMTYSLRFQNPRQNEEEMNPRLYNHIKGPLQNPILISLTPEDDIEGILSGRYRFDKQKNELVPKDNGYRNGMSMSDASFHF